MNIKNTSIAIVSLALNFGNAYAATVQSNELLSIDFYMPQSPIDPEHPANTVLLSLELLEVPPSLNASAMKYDGNRLLGSSSSEYYPSLNNRNLYFLWLDTHSDFSPFAKPINQTIDASALINRQIDGHLKVTFNQTAYISAVHLYVGYGWMGSIKDEWAVVSNVYVSQASSVPESGAFPLAISGISVAMLFMRRRKMWKSSSASALKISGKSANKTTEISPLKFSRSGCGLTVGSTRTKMLRIFAG
jgi:hypothetical protein